MTPMKLKTLFCLGLIGFAVAAQAQYQDFSRMGKTPAELQFIDDPMEIELKEPSWFWHNPEKDTPELQLAYAARLERKGEIEEALEAYDDLVHEWHATPQALTAQLALARIHSARGDARKAYEEDIYLLAHFAGRFELEPVLKDVVAQADQIATSESNKTLRLHSGEALRKNYERIVHFAPRWHRTPDLLMKIAQLYVDDEEYASAITVCDRIVVDWPTYKRLTDLVSLYCEACRKQATAWRNDIGRLKQMERLIKGAVTFYPNHPKRAIFLAWQEEIYQMRHDLAYKQTSFYDNPKAYSVQSAELAYRDFLRQYPESPKAEEIRQRIAALSLARNTGKTPEQEERK